MMKKQPTTIVNDVRYVKKLTEDVLADYLKEYAEYGMDDIANDIINIIAALEHVRCKLQHSIVKEDDDDAECYF